MTIGSMKAPLLRVKPPRSVVTPFPQEIASILEVTVAIVKTRLHRSRLVVREALAGYLVERRHTSA